MQNAITPASTRAYSRAWQLFHQYSNTYGIPFTLPVSVPTLSLYIAYLVSDNYAPSTVTSYISAISYVHKIRGIADPTNAFIILKVLHSYRSSKPRVDCRLPITKAILHHIVEALNFTTLSIYKRKLFTAMFLLAFHAFLRIGEMAFAPLRAFHILQYSQVTCYCSALQVNFKTYKHSNGRSFCLTIPRKDPSAFCPVSALQAYLSLRGNRPGPLFAYPPATPVTRSEFGTELKRALVFKQYAADKFQSHSFRVGAATECHLQGLSDSQIRTLGRWKSEAFKRYIRIFCQSSDL